MLSELSGLLVLKNDLFRVIHNNLTCVPWSSIYHIFLSTCIMKITSITDLWCPAVEISQLTGMLMLHWGEAAVAVSTTVNSLDISHPRQFLGRSLAGPTSPVPGGEKFHIFDWRIQRSATLPGSCLQNDLPRLYFKQKRPCICYYCNYDWECQGKV